MQRDVKSKRGKEREVEVEVREGDEIRRSKEGGRQTPNASYRATRFLTAAGFSSSTRSSQTQLTYRKRFSSEHKSMHILNGETGEWD